MPNMDSKDRLHYKMSRIKSKDTQPELIVRKYLFNKGFRYRLNVKDLPGKPDIVLPKYRTIIFVHGCFWHGHPGCKYSVIPKTRTAWWTEKIRKNVERDLRQHTELRQAGWNILTVWECQLKPKMRTVTLEGIVLLLQKTWLNKLKKPAMVPYRSSLQELTQVAEEDILYGEQETGL